MTATRAASQSPEPFILWISAFAFTVSALFYLLLLGAVASAFNSNIPLEAFNSGPYKAFHAL